MNKDASYSLAITGPDNITQLVRVSLPVALLGRGPQCDVVVWEDWVSPQHAILEWNGANLLLHDLDSANGTFVDGKPLLNAVRVPLNVGDTFQMGTRVTVRLARVSPHEDRRE